MLSKITQAAAVMTTIATKLANKAFIIYLPMFHLA